MGSSVFTIGLSGLKAANLGLTTAGHNIANVNTAGYSRQSIQQSAPYPALSGSGYVGLGVRVDNVTRTYDQFLTRQVQTTQAKASYYETYYSHIAQIDNLVADSSAGVSPAMQNYFSAVQNVATNPSNLPARETMLSSAQIMINRFQMVNQQLADQRTSLNGEISNAVSSINAYARQIADLNQQIVLNSATGLSPNDLLDQRDQMVKELNSLVKASTVTQSDGSINVFIGSGQNLVVGGQTFELAAVPSPADPQSTTVVYKQNNNVIYLPESSLGGGQLGALLDFRTSSLNMAQNNLAMVAVGMAQMLNAQQRAGMDLNGNLGQNLFDYKRENSLSFSAFGLTIDISAPLSAIPASEYSLEYDGTRYTLTRLSDGKSENINVTDMASADGVSVLGVTLKASGATPSVGNAVNWSFPPDLGYISQNALNTGSGTLDGYISDIGALAASDYELSFDGNQFILTRLSDSTKTAFSLADVAAGPITQDGLTFNVGGGWNAGDKFTIKPYEGFIDSLSVRITDAREIAAASPVRASSGSANTGSASMSQPIPDTPSTSATDAAVDPSLRNPVNIVFTSANSFTVTDSVTGVSSTRSYTAGMTLSVNGWSLSITGQPAAGDTFSVGPNAAGTEDGSNALKLAELQTRKLLSGGTATFGQSYSQMVARVGVQTNEAGIMADAQATMLTQAETARDSVSGVNLDEEAASLLRYQQAYIAASKLIQIAQQAFQQIADIV